MLRFFYFNLFLLCTLCTRRRVIWSDPPDWGWAQAHDPAVTETRNFDVFDTDITQTAGVAAGAVMTPIDPIVAPLQRSNVIARQGVNRVFTV